MGKSAKSQLLRELAGEEAAIAEHERMAGEARARARSLRGKLAALPNRNAAAIPVAPLDKVRLFRSLFRGRPDVFPVQFTSRKTGKRGYAPLCSNKWAPGLCALRSGGKCGDCANQAFAPVSDKAIADHLQGRHVMGVYPLLDDERCWVLAVDFDKRSWREDVAAFVETCEAVDVPVAIERSRSGQGAHAWFFFTAPAPASVARRMGCYLITETMSRRHELSMSSYDRLFPNQDTMPRGGFGNLIALPLQHEPRQQENSVFVDKNLEPFANQWAFLASVKRIEPGAVEAIASEATLNHQLPGARVADLVDDEQTMVPWMRSPSGRFPAQRITDPLPSVVKTVLAQRFFIEKAGLPSLLLSQLKRLAAFQNPEFYKKQKMRLSTALTPRVIACAEELPRFLALPRGCTADVEQLLNEYGARLVIEDQRSDGKALEVNFGGRLTAIQEQAARALLSKDTGVFVGPPGIGKTVLGTWLVAQRARSTLILVHRKPLLEQWVAQLAMFLDIKENEVGQIGGGKRKPNGRLDVAMIQSLVRKEKVDDLVAGYGHIIVDECHHIPAVSFERVLSEAKARYLVGLTATPQRRDGQHPIIAMQLGSVRFKADAKSQAARQSFRHKLIVRETAFTLANEKPGTGIQETYRALANDETRNQSIVADVIAALEEGRSPILITERKDHLEYFAEQFQSVVRHLVVLQGGMTNKGRRGSIDQMSSIPDTAERLVLATGRYIGEGFDDARLDTLFLTMPISWKGTLIQYTGRLHRRHPSKAEVQIYDYVDREVPMLLRMFDKRLATYRAIGYEHAEAPSAIMAPPEEPVVEYDEQALRHFEQGTGGSSK